MLRCPADSRFGALAVLGLNPGASTSIMFVSFTFLVYDVGNLMPTWYMATVKSYYHGKESHQYIQRYISWKSLILDFNILSLSRDIWIGPSTLLQGMKFWWGHRLMLKVLGESHCVSQKNKSFQNQQSLERRPQKQAGWWPKGRWQIHLVDIWIPSMCQALFVGLEIQWWFKTDETLTLIEPTFYLKSWLTSIRNKSNIWSKDV